MTAVVPPRFAALIERRDGGADWLRRLPGLVDEYLAEWDLELDGAPLHGECALVLPVRWRAQLAALKLTWPHEEARLEHLALRLWNGHGAVRLLAVNPADQVLLLERLSPRELTSVPILEGCEEIGELFGRLDRPATPQFTAVADLAQRWAEQLASGSELVPRRQTQQALAMLAELLADGPHNRLVHEDLHDMNVLAPLDPARGRWLAIDPKPVAGEWAYAVAPIVWNRADVAARAHSLRTHVRLRAEVVADVAGLDLDRVQAWTFIRLVLNAVGAAQFAPESDDFRSRMITLAKAFADPLG